MVLNRIVFSRRMLAVLLLGFSSGLPLALTGTTLQAWYTVAGVPIVTIGMLSLVGQPYVYKFIWAPLFDRYVPPLIGHRRGWIWILQLCLAVGLAGMGLLHPATMPWAMASVAMVVAFFSATQDINIDAYRTDLLTSEERGFGAAMAAGGYRLAMLVSGGIAMVFAAEIGWRATYFIMAVLMLVNTLVTLAAPALNVNPTSPMTLKAAVIEPFIDFLKRDKALMIFAFIVLYKLGDAFTIVLTPTFLLRGIGFSLIDVGTIYKIVGMISVVLGTFVGGLIMTRLDIYRSLLYFGCLQALSSLSFMFLALAGKSYPLMIVSVFAEDFCIGLATVALVAYIMQLCNRRYTATQFALLSALQAVGRVMVGPIAGVMVVHVGWLMFYFYSFVLAFPGLFVLRLLRNVI